MKNKSIAILGIVSYFFDVITSATDSSGNFLLPGFLIILSGLIGLFFTIAAIINLWKVAKHISIMLGSSTILLYTLTTVQEIALSQYGSPIIIFLNIVKIVHLFAFIFAITLLWRKS